jgi:prepilin-type N-terminal cleavage/methylation domain-containing protein
MDYFKCKEQGFTLLEMLLVLVIISSIVIMGLNYTLQKSAELRRDKATLQYQQILNAGLAYYLSESKWPTLEDLQVAPGGYLPNIPLINPWGYPYEVAEITPKKEGGTLFYVYSQVPAKNATDLAQANALAGRLPMAFTTMSDPPDPTVLCVAKGEAEGKTEPEPEPESEACYLAASVSVPGQNLNNARSINFSNLYHHGGCVPAPECPANMTPTIMVVPTSVSGVNDRDSVVTYPISSFTAYAYGKANGTATPDSSPAQSDQVAECLIPGAIPNARTCQSTIYTNIPPKATDKFWRVCLRIITSKGDVSETNPEKYDASWGKYVSLLAVTYCEPGSPPSKKVGSDFKVYSN